MTVQPSALSEALHHYISPAYHTHFGEGALDDAASADLGRCLELHALFHLDCDTRAAARRSKLSELGPRSWKRPVAETKAEGATTGAASDGDGDSASDVVALRAKLLAAEADAAEYRQKAAALKATLAMNKKRVQRGVAQMRLKVEAERAPLLERLRVAEAQASQRDGASGDEAGGGGQSATDAAARIAALLAELSEAQAAAANYKGKATNLMAKLVQMKSKVSAAVSKLKEKLGAEHAAEIAALRAELAAARGAS